MILETDGVHANYTPNHLPSLQIHYNAIKTYLYRATRANKNVSFNDFKQMFSLDVNSPRKLSMVKNMPELMELLETRRAIHLLKPNLFQRIFDFYSLDKQLLDEYYQLLFTVMPSVPVFEFVENVYEAEVRNSVPLATQLHNLGYNITPTVKCNNVMPTVKCNNCSENTQRRKNRRNGDLNIILEKVNNVTPPKQQPQSSKSASDETVAKYLFPERVFELVNAVGYKWKELARRLKVKEGRIGEIDNDKSLNLDSKIKMILSDYQSTCVQDFREHEIHSGLLLALEKIKRNDLRNNVDSFLKKYNERHS